MWQEYSNSERSLGCKNIPLYCLFFNDLYSWRDPETQMFDKYTQISVSKEIERNMYAEGLYRKEPGVSVSWICALPTVQGLLSEHCQTFILWGKCLHACTF